LQPEITSSLQWRKNIKECSSCGKPSPKNNDIYIYVTS
jgi:hypothetical protein